MTQVSMKVEHSKLFVISNRVQLALVRQSKSHSFALVKNVVTEGKVYGKPNFFSFQMTKLSTLRIKF